MRKDTRTLRRLLAIAATFAVAFSLAPAASAAAEERAKPTKETFVIKAGYSSENPDYCASTDPETSRVYMELCDTTDPSQQWTTMDAKNGDASRLTTGDGLCAANEPGTRDYVRLVDCDIDSEGLWWTTFNSRIEGAGGCWENPDPDGDEPIYAVKGRCKSGPPSYQAWFMPRIFSWTAGHNLHVERDVLRFAITYTCDTARSDVTVDIDARQKRSLGGEITGEPTTLSLSCPTGVRGRTVTAEVPTTDGSQWREGYPGELDVSVTGKNIPDDSYSYRGTFYKKRSLTFH